MQPSEKYTVDYTDSYGFKWTKPIGTIYPEVGRIDESIGLSRYDADIMKTVYRKSDVYNPMYDDSITFDTVPGQPTERFKFFRRTSFPTADVNINTVIVNNYQPDGDAYSIGTDENVYTPLLRGSMDTYRLLRDAEYNKMIFRARAKKLNFTTHTNVIQKDTYDDPSYEYVEIKDIDENAFYGYVYARGCYVWNGSSWILENAAPVLMCTGEQNQTFQGMASSFNNTMNTYSSAPLGTGQNITLTTQTSIEYYNGQNFQSKMNNDRYCLGFSDTFVLRGQWQNDPDATYATIRQWLIDNSIPQLTAKNFEVTREVISVSDYEAVLYTETIYAYLDNNNDLYVISASVQLFPMITGKCANEFLAGLGLYYVVDDSVDLNLSGITPSTLSNCSDVWLGEMLADGTTTGKWIKGADIDNYNGYNKDGNIVNPDYDPSGGGGGGGGYDDDPWHGVSFAGTGVGGAGAFAKCYYMTSTELANLRSWMNSINVPEGFDPMQQIIGLSQVPVALSGSGPENVVFVNSSAVYDPGVTTRAVDTGVATQQAMGTPISYYLGSVDIARRMQQRGEPYLDYDCQIELYLPLIGMFSLDTQAVMGRTISAYAVLDPVSGTLAAYAYVSKDGQNLPVAYGSTTIGVDLPISAQQLSVSRAALKQANAQLGASLLSGALTMLAAASSGKASGTGAKTSTGSSGLSAAGIREAGSDYMKASQVGNVFGDFMNWGRTIRQLSYGNNTAVAGSFGGSTAQWAYPFTPYVKIIRPRFEKPSNYAHSQGVPCVQTKTIGSCTGFIQCIGADVSGISGATDLELQAIQAALSNGIYAGGGQ